MEGCTDGVRACQQRPPARSLEPLASFAVRQEAKQRCRVFLVVLQQVRHVLRPLPAQRLHGRGVQAATVVRIVRDHRCALRRLAVPALPATRHSAHLRPAASSRLVAKW